MICPRVCHFGAQETMVICVVIGCSNRSDRDRRISFYRIPAVTSHYEEREFELSVKRRAAFLPLFHEKILMSTIWRSIKFVRDTSFPVNLPKHLPWQLHLGHTKRQQRSQGDRSVGEIFIIIIIRIFQRQQRMTK